jgi:hypothetical protein
MCWRGGPVLHLSTILLISSVELRLGEVENLKASSLPEAGDSKSKPKASLILRTRQSSSFSLCAETSCEFSVAVSLNCDDG